MTLTAVPQGEERQLRHRRRRGGDRVHASSGTARAPRHSLLRRVQRRRLPDASAAQARCRPK